jgi:hypothetical protein
MIRTFVFYGNPTHTAYSIIASEGMVAADYQGMFILKANGMSAAYEAVARNVFALAAADKLSGDTKPLGTNDPANMDIVNLTPPYSTAVTCRGSSTEKNGLFVKMTHTAGSPKITFKLDRRFSGPARLSVFSVDGARIWASDRLEWHGRTFHGTRVCPGT